jgi:hypothetical protein
MFVGLLNGEAVLLGRNGSLVFSFEPGGSDYAVILGCAVSRNGSRLALVSGIDAQRFLLLERFENNANDYRVVYNEFLDSGYRRPVHVSFIEDDRWVVFERTGGLCFYEIGSRLTRQVKLGGDIVDIDDSGGQGIVFVVTAPAPGEKELVGIRVPERLVVRAPFKTEETFLRRSGSQLFIGGRQFFVSFYLEKR